DRWRGRVVLDPAASGGLRLFPFQKDWPMERSTAWAQNVAANGTKLVATDAQLLSQGEADLSMLSFHVAAALIAQGAPLAYASSEFVFAQPSVTCLTAIPKNDPNLAELFFGWDNMDGNYIEAQLTGGGVRPFFAPEADKFPLGKVMKELGYTTD